MGDTSTDFKSIGTYPGEKTSTRYRPGGTAGIANDPSSPETAWKSPFPSSATIVTGTSATGRFSASTKVPRKGTPVAASGAPSRGAPEAPCAEPGSSWGAGEGAGLGSSARGAMPGASRIAVSRTAGTRRPDAPDRRGARPEMMDMVKEL